MRRKSSPRNLSKAQLHLFKFFEDAKAQSPKESPIGLDFDEDMDPDEEMIAEENFIIPDIGSK